LREQAGLLRGRGARFSALEQPRPLLGREEYAMLDLVEPAVAIARHQCIDHIAPPFGDDGAVVQSWTVVGNIGQTRSHSTR